MASKSKKKTIPNEDKETILVSEGFDINQLDPESLLEPEITSKRKRERKAKIEQTDEEENIIHDVDESVEDVDEGDYILLLVGGNNLILSGEIQNVTCKTDNLLKVTLALSLSSMSKISKIIKSFLKGDNTKNLLVFLNAKYGGLMLFDSSLYTSKILEITVVNNTSIEMLVKV